MLTLTPPTENEQDNRTLIDALLAEQRDLTAVDRFARWHENHNEGSHVASRYKNLIPLNAPGPGEQYAFEVDLDKCSGCKACVAACHSLNGLDENETWRDVGLLVSSDFSGYSHSIQHVTTACHHCVDPGCLKGCPVLAYDKDPVTGIVRHLDDQCIGCKYCTLMCPYEVPKYSESRGIVRKCDMCHQRLAHGEAPACVQSCPNEAIRITLVKPAEIKDRNAFLPDSPDPKITFPTTSYTSSRNLNLLMAADHNVPRLDHPHWPLVVMLIFTQGAVGLYLAAAFVQSPASNFIELVGFTVLNIGLLAAPLHLGQPLKAWRAFLGWKTSWLSREILAFNVFAPLAAAVTLIAWLPFLEQRFPGFTRFLPKGVPEFSTIETVQFSLTIAAAIIGLGSVAVSAMVYTATQRPFWSLRHSIGAFFGTTALLGAIFSSVILSWSNDLSLARCFAIIALIVRSFLFVWRRVEINLAFNNPESDIHPNARTILELLSWTPSTRLALFVTSMFFGLLAIVNFHNRMMVWAGIAAVTTLAAEILVRWIFFVAGAGKKMPGGINV